MAYSSTSWRDCSSSSWLKRISSSISRTPGCAHARNEVVQLFRGHGLPRCLVGHADRYELRKLLKGKGLAASSGSGSQILPRAPGGATPLLAGPHPHSGAGADAPLRRPPLSPRHRAPAAPPAGSVSQTLPPGTRCRRRGGASNPFRHAAYCPWEGRWGQEPRQHGPFQVAVAEASPTDKYAEVWVTLETAE